MMDWKKPAVAASAAGVILISWFEGYSPKATQPLAGDKWTVGFGHTEQVTPSTTTTLEQAFRLLKVDVARAERVVREYVKVTLNQNQFDALTCLVFNIGSAAFVRSTLLKRVNAGDVEGVKREWMRWKYFNGKVVQGLERRRELELAVYLGKQVQVVVGDRVCYSAGNCYDFSSLLASQVSQSDGAEYGGDDESEHSNKGSGRSADKAEGGA